MLLYEIDLAIFVDAGVLARLRATFRRVNTPEARRLRQVMAARRGFRVMDAAETAAGSPTVADIAAAVEVVEQTPPPKISGEHEVVAHAEDVAEVSKNNEDP